MENLLVALILLAVCCLVGVRLFKSFRSGGCGSCSGCGGGSCSDPKKAKEEEK